MNTRFLISPAYLLSIALLVAGAVLSGSRYMLIGWMLFLVGVFLNAMTLVILTNREQLRQIRQAHQHQKEQAEREQTGESPREPSAKELDVEPYDEHTGKGVLIRNLRKKMRLSRIIHHSRGVNLHLMLAP